MKPFVLSLIIVAASGFLAACTPKPATPPAVATPTASAAPTAMDMPAAKSGKGVGTITAIDASAGTVTINHKDIPEIGWSGMEMPFKAAPEILKGAKVGEQIEFDVTVTDEGGEITALKAR